MRDKIIEPREHGRLLSNVGQAFLPGAGSYGGHVRLRRPTASGYARRQSPHTDWMMLNAAITAVSARKMRGPSDTGMT
jgi:hypothetical protein